MSDPPGAVLYTRADCPLCFALGRLAERAARRHGVGLRKVDVDAAPELAQRYGDRVPVLEFPDGGSIAGRSEARAVDEAFRRAALVLRLREKGERAAGGTGAPHGIVPWLRRRFVLRRARRGDRTA